MCGISGVWHPEGGEASHESLRQMMSAIRHRGPEGAAFARLDQGRLLFGFLALGFTDQANGMQPLFNEDHSIALIYNGEIYDHEALRSDLQARGHRFRTASDSEVLIHLYEEYGPRFVEQLNGEFAFVLWDRAQQKLLLVRDRFGVKPLCIARHRGAWVFASETKALLAIDGFERAIAPAFFTGPGIGLADCAMTPFVGISSVRPGHIMEIDRKGMTQRAYWKPDTSKPEYDIEEASIRVRAALTKAVARRVDGGVPIAVALSSGLDSSIVAGLIAQRRPDVPAFGVSFPGAAYDESASAARTAAHYGIDFTPVTCSIEALSAGFMDTIWSLETVTNSLSPVARIEMTRAVRAAGRKALTGGEGADECFGGYPYFGIESIWRLLGTPQASQRAKGQQAWKDFQQKEADSRGNFWDQTKAWQQVPPLFGYPSAYHIRALRSRSLMGTLLSPAYREQLGASAPIDSVFREFDIQQLRTLDPFDATRMISRSILGCFALPGLGDRVEMANSLEGRAPFLDRDVISLAFSLSEKHCIDQATQTRKFILRHAFADLLPPDFASRPKHIYMAPTFADMAKTDTGRAWMERLLSPKAVKAAGILNPMFVRGLHLAWRFWPRRHWRFAQIDSLLGYLLSVQALHHIFLESSDGFGHKEPLLPLDIDRSPPATSSLPAIQIRPPRAHHDTPQEGGLLCLQEGALLSPPETTLDIPASSSFAYKSQYHKWQGVEANHPRDTSSESIQGKVAYPKHLAPIAEHPLIEARGEAFVSQYLARHLLHYLEFTEDLEHTLVNSATFALGRGKIGFSLPDAMREDAWKIYVEEANHAKSSADLIRIVEGLTGIKHAAYATHPFLLHVRDLQDRYPAHAELVLLFASIVSETLISSTLTGLPKAKEVFPVVRAVTAEHAIDEGRHHQYFCQLLACVWPQLRAEQRSWIGPHLPSLIHSFAQPYTAPLRRDLEAMGLTPQEATRVITESYPAEAQATEIRQTARHTVQLFAAQGAFEHPCISDSFAKHSLHANA